MFVSTAQILPMLLYGYHNVSTCHSYLALSKLYGELGATGSSLHDMKQASIRVRADHIEREVKPTRENILHNKILIRSDVQNRIEKSLLDLYSLTFLDDRILITQI